MTKAWKWVAGGVAALGSLLLVALTLGMWRRGSNRAASDAAREDTRATREEGERDVEAASTEASEEYDAMALAERLARENSGESVGDYFDRHTGHAGDGDS